MSKFVSLSPLPFGFTVITTRAQYARLGKSHPWVEDTKAAAFIVANKQAQTIAVCVHPQSVRKTYGDVALARFIVHESVHVFQTVCEWAGEDRPGREMEAYFIDFIFSQIMDAICVPTKRGVR